jgi:hypothetical protein
MNKIRKSHIVATVIAAITMGLAAGSASAGGLLSVDFAAGDFGASKNVNNPHWPLAPGMVATTFIYLGETEDGCVFDKVESKPEMSKVFTVAPYDSVVPLVVVDTEWEVEEMECDEMLDQLLLDNTWTPDDGMGELTHDWYAQDGFKNIWYMGEASRDFGEVEIDGVETACPSLGEVPLGTERNLWPSDELFLECTAGSWEAGQPGQEEGEVIGMPGIVVPSDTPFGDETGDPLSPGTYWMQEVAENAQDMAKVLRTIAPLDDYELCRKVKEWNPFEHGGSVEHKWYCMDGRGLELIKGIGGGPTEVEELVLVFTP